MYLVLGMGCFVVNMQDYLRFGQSEFLIFGKHLSWFYMFWQGKYKLVCLNIANDTGSTWSLFLYVCSAFILSGVYWCQLLPQISLRICPQYLLLIMIGNSQGQSFGRDRSNQEHVLQQVCRDKDTPTALLKGRTRRASDKMVHSFTDNGGVFIWLKNSTIYTQPTAKNNDGDADVLPFVSKLKF